MSRLRHLPPRIEPDSVEAEAVTVVMTPTGPQVAPIDQQLQDTVEFPPSRGTVYNNEPTLQKPGSWQNLSVANGVNDDVVLPTGLDPNDGRVRFLSATLAFSITSFANPL